MSGGPPKYAIIAVEDNSVVARKLAPDSVLTSKIKDKSVTQEKLADGAVGAAALDPAVLNDTFQLTIPGQIDSLVLLTPLTGSEWVLIEDPADSLNKRKATTQQVADLALAIGGVVPKTMRAVTVGSYAAAVHDAFLADASGGLVTIILPAVAGAIGRSIWIKKVDATPNGVVISAGGPTIDGAPSVTLIITKASIEVVSDGTNWHILA